MNKLIEKFHGRYIVDRRISVLSSHILKLLPGKEKILDVGCGDGRLMATVAAGSSIKVHGVDVVPREQTYIPVELYNGHKLPFADNAHDIIVLMDVLHHAADIRGLLQESIRVGRKSIIIKDHLVHGVFSSAILKLMDQVGNRRFNVCLECQYLTRTQWMDMFKDLGLGVEIWNEQMGLYPFPLSLIFDRNLHFLAKLNIKN